MPLLSAGYIIPLAVVLDLMIADPLFLPHPIRWMGLAIERFEPVFRPLRIHPGSSGFLFAAVLIGATWTITWLVVRTAFLIHPWVGGGVEVILVFYCISARSLEKAAMAVWERLIGRDLDGARRSVGMIVGRETGHLTEKGVARAAVETVAENYVDGFLSPLFFAVIGGAPLAMTYKMINTLDSMIGYKNDRYAEFGKAAARIDDVANYIPARLSFLFIALAARMLNKSGSSSLATALAEGKNHTSPNAGFPEAAVAGALRVRLNGPNVYHGEVVDKPYIGKSFPEVAFKHIKQACDLMLLASLLAAAAFGGIWWMGQRLLY
ncbi:MAG: cobalamin biosynthesis protein CobD [Desulfobacteraceae bacterium]|nr:cobalamin biosynthesis protein CobD [Desulfobacteraceae bacterium]